ncbi:heme NO-binding domain-containing protein [Tengunoibacter tsumagoiensis]|uniref:Heme NO-binding domain-containing protein n=1 Tax=Tengunoibacter tsumagoiensis TaxID=2014871 RepID=A0A402A0K2_9CHLR|nr:heme NO-binding domain-containing protein [Tengunoibacter tsumagoiensis]GCE12541.1 hypothetical protein KTT_24000 [Tengunoibacter tsumagoiensis]
MHGLIFVTWEKFLAERFGPSTLYEYRASIGETAATAPLANRIYNDGVLLAGVQAAHRITGVEIDALLRDYGRYFIMNGLTSHLCAYLLTRVGSASELLLTMRDAHAQMRRTPDGLTPPLFRYDAISTDKQKFFLLYDSPRQLCSVLLGAIEGAAARYHEQVRIVERTCMKQGANACRIEIHFQPGEHHPRRAIPDSELQAQQQTKQQFAEFVLNVLPYQHGVTLSELQNYIERTSPQFGSIRPRVLLEALRYLQYAGLIASTANQPGEDFARRRYWRVPTLALLRR